MNQLNYIINDILKYLERPDATELKHVLRRCRVFIGKFLQNDKMFFDSVFQLYIDC